MHERSGTDRRELRVHVNLLDRVCHTNQEGEGNEDPSAHQTQIETHFQERHRPYDDEVGANRSDEFHGMTSCTR